MNSDLAITILVAASLLVVGVLCSRIAQTSKLRRWLYRQSFVFFALIPVAIAVGLDSSDRYSATLGNIVGLCWPLYMAYTWRSVARETA